MMSIKHLIKVTILQSINLLGTYSFSIGVLTQLYLISRVPLIQDQRPPDRVNLIVRGSTSIAIKKESSSLSIKLQ